MLLPLIILGIAAVAAAAVAIYGALTAAEREAEEKFSDSPVGSLVQGCSTVLLFLRSLAAHRNGLYDR